MNLFEMYPQIKEVVNALASDQRLGILGCLYEKGSLDYNGLKELQIKNINKHLKILMNVGLITKETVSGSYLLTDYGEYMIDYALPSILIPSRLEKWKYMVEKRKLELKKLEEKYKPLL